ncbi:MAG TPA: DUF6152 family protein [Gammaproteobacteria bacterium]
MFRSRYPMLTAVAGLVLAGSASAHHGFGTFDLTKDVVIRGVITKVDFVNPHSWLYVTAIEDGEEVQWRCEMRAATVLRRSGWSPEMFQDGQQVTITGSPDRYDGRSCYLSTIAWADGTSMNRYGQREKAAVAARRERELRLPSGELNISGDWAPEQLVMTDPRGREGTLVPLSEADEYAPGEVPEGAAPIPGARNAPPQTGAAPRRRASPVELTAEGMAAAEGFDPRSPEDNPRLRCETTSIIFDWTFDGPVNRITQNGDTIVLQYGQYGFTRTIHMNAEHPQVIEPSRAGHSVGRWENDVLIVDTIGFLPGVLTGSTLHSDRLHVVERFSYDPERMALTREYTAEDPRYFVGRLEGSDTVYPADVRYSPDPCKELTFVDYEELTEAGSAQQAPPAEPPAKPWWKFWD